jgi:hypothetical protein
VSANPGQTASGPKPPPALPAPVQAGAFRVHPSTRLTSPVVTPFPDSGAVQIAYDGGAWDWATDAATARANAAAWTEAADRLDAMNAAGAAGKAAA